MTLPGATPEPAVEATDHARVVRHFGIGYMGRREITINPAGPVVVNAPIIGVRYWLDPMIGIDAGVGLLFSGGSTENGDTSTDLQGYTVFMLHGGVPLALAGSKHFSFQVIPELNFGIAGSKTAPAAGPGADLSGIHFDIGARAGGEIQFGFIGIPELSLQAGVGLAFNYDHSKSTPTGEAPQPRVARPRSARPWATILGTSSPATSLPCTTSDAEAGMSLKRSLLAIIGCGLLLGCGGGGRADATTFGHGRALGRSAATAGSHARPRAGLADSGNRR